MQYFGNFKYKNNKNLTLIKIKILYLNKKLPNFNKQPSPTYHNSLTYLTNPIKVNFPNQCRYHYRLGGNTPELVILLRGIL